MKYKPTSNRFESKKRGGKKLGALKGFFKWGENVPHLSRKEKILARALEKIQIKILKINFYCAKSRLNSIFQQDLTWLFTAFIANFSTCFEWNKMLH